MTNETAVTNLPVSAIKVDPACQARAEMNTETINEYAEIMKERGDESFPAIVVFHDGKDHWLSDGFHRYEAAEKAGLSTLKSRVRQGTRRDAILNSVGANARHGLRRTNADKRRAVSILLEDEVWSTWSNREIARLCGVDEGLVRKVKDEQDPPSSASADCPQITRKVERNGTAFEMKTGNIGKKDGGAQQSPLQPDPNDGPEQVWDHTRRPAETEANPAELSDDEPASSSEQPCSSDVAQLRELLSVWSRASREVREQFLANIGVSQAKTYAGLADDEPSQEPASSGEPSAPQSEQVQSPEPRANALFEMWKDYKANTQVAGRQWIVDGCPSEYRDSHFTITHRLVPFRAAALAATEPERDQFLELSGANDRVG